MRVFLASSHRSVLRIRSPSSGGKCSVNRRSFVVGVVARRRGAAQIGKALADAGPEIAGSGRGVTGAHLARVQCHVPNANDSGRRSPLSITSSATVGGFGRMKHELVRAGRQA